MSSALGLFDYLSIINEKKSIPDKLEGYDNFMINKAYSQSMDTVFIANAINVDCPSIYNFDYYYFGLSKQRRYSKWSKKDKVKVDSKNVLNNIMEYYNCSKEKAQDIYDILEYKNLLDDFAETNFKGGKSR